MGAWMTQRQKSAPQLLHSSQAPCRSVSLLQAAWLMVKLGCAQQSFAAFMLWEEPCVSYKLVKFLYFLSLTSPSLLLARNVSIPRKLLHMLTPCLRSRVFVGLSRKRWQKSLHRIVQEKVRKSLTMIVQEKVRKSLRMCLGRVTLVHPSFWLWFNSDTAYWIDS